MLPGFRPASTAIRWARCAGPGESASTRWRRRRVQQPDGSRSPTDSSSQPGSGAPDPIWGTPLPRGLTLPESNRHTCTVLKRLLADLGDGNTRPPARSSPHRRPDPIDDMKRLLIVDDDVDALESLKLLLE